jgi:hypothetical protein
MFDPVQRRQSSNAPARQDVDSARASAAKVPLSEISHNFNVPACAPYA